MHKPFMQQCLKEELTLKALDVFLGNQTVNTEKILYDMGREDQWVG